jgi:hypothetical protein
VAWRGARAAQKNPGKRSGQNEKAKPEKVKAVKALSAD